MQNKIKRKLLRNKGDRVRLQKYLKKSVDKEQNVVYNANSSKRTKRCTKEVEILKEVTLKELRLKKKMTQEQVAKKSRSHKGLYFNDGACKKKSK